MIWLRLRCNWPELDLTFHGTDTEAQLKNQRDEVYKTTPSHVFLLATSPSGLRRRRTRCELLEEVWWITSCTTTDMISYHVQRIANAPMPDVKGLFAYLLALAQTECYVIQREESP